MAKTIFFDLGNVFLSVNKDHAVQEFSKRCTLPSGKSVIEINWNLEDRFERGHITINEYLSAFNNIYHPITNISLDEHLDIWGNIFSPLCEVWSLLPILKNQTTIFLLSNTNALHIQSVRKRWDLLDKFDRLFLSYELGCRKPELEIYRKSLKAAGISATDSIFIDDLSENIEAAASLGMTTHQFVDATKLKAFLQGQGFKITL